MAASSLSRAKWILLTYKVPRQPAASRVYVWRKLKQLGAIALQDAAWALPATAKTHEQFQWLATEICELGGEARLWQSTLVLEISDSMLEKQFIEQVDAEYKEILAALKRKNQDVAALARQFQHALAHDFFSSELGKKVRKKLLASGNEGAS